MAEYYPLLSRAVADLRDAPPEQRRAIYDRARQALLGQLRSMQPPVPEDAIERESGALDASIERLEGEIAKTAVPHLASTEAAQPAAPAKPVLPASPTMAPAEPAKPPDAVAATSPEPIPTTQDVMAEQAAVIPAAPELRPGDPIKPDRRPLPTPARTTIRPVAPTAAARPPVAAKPAPTRPIFGPRAASGSPTPAPAAPSTPALRASRGVEEAPTALPSAPRLQVAPLAKEPVDLDASASSGAAAEVGGAAVPADPEPSARDDVLRPAAPRPVLREQFNPRLIIVAAVAALVIAGISYTAWRLRDKPESLARSRAAMLAAQQTEQQPGKVVNRADGGAAVPPVVTEQTAPDGAATSAPPASPEPPPTQPAAPAQPLSTTTAPEASGVATATPDAAPQPTGNASTVPAQPAPTSESAPAGAVANTADLQSVPVAQRAALLVDAPDDPKKVKTYVGTVVWRTESVSPGQGQPLATAVRAEIDVPEAALKLSMLFQKNAEPQFPASHTMEFRFTPEANNTLGNVKQINVPQMRQDDSPTGDPLVGLPVTITENYFLVGLSRGDATVHNLELIKARNWFDVPLLLASGKVAKITFEKGAVGQQVIDSAVQSWQ